MRRLTGATQNVLQRGNAVNGVVLREKKVSSKTKGGRVGRLSAKICKWFIPALHSRLATPWGP